MEICAIIYTPGQFLLQLLLLLPSLLLLLCLGFCCLPFLAFPSSFSFFIFCFGMTTLQRLLRVWAELWPGPAMFVCFGCKQLSVISDKLIWQSTGDQHAGWQHCQGAGGRGRRRRTSKSGACAKKRWKLLPLLPLTMAVAMSMRCVRGCCPLSLF